MSMRLLFPNAFAIARMSCNVSNSPMSSFNYFFGIKHFHSVCTAAKYHSGTSRYLSKSLNTRLLVPKPNVLHRSSSAGCHVLQKYIPSLRSKNKFRTSSYPYDSILGHETELKQYCSSTNEKKDSKSCEKGVNEEAPPKLTIVQRFKAMLKDYWHVLIPVHVITSVGWFGGFYYLATSGIDIPSLMESLNFSETFVKPFRDSSMGYIAVAYGLYKIATPIRYTVTVGGTSVAIRVLKTRGLVQPWPINFKWLKTSPTPKKRRSP